MIKKEEEERTFELDELEKRTPVLAIPWTKEDLEIFGKLRKYQLKHHINTNDLTKEERAKIISGEID